MGARRRVEGFGRWVLAWVVAAILHRPWRRARARRLLGTAPRRVLLVRTDNRVGEALLTTPVVATLAARSPAPQIDVLVHPKVARVLEGLPGISQLLPFSRRQLWPFSAALRSLRAARYDVVVDCANWVAPSLASAVAARLAGARSAVVGPAGFPSRLLCDVAVAPLPDTPNEVAQRVHLLSPLPGHQPRAGLAFRQPRVGPAVAGLLDALRATPFAVLNPGGRLGLRRVPPEAFGAAAQALAGRGLLPVVTWGPGEEALAATVAAAEPRAKVAPPTSLDELAALMAAAKVTVCNNTGPMHLAVAVAAPTLAFFLREDPRRWGHLGASNRMVDLTSTIEAGEPVVFRVREETLRMLDALGL